MFPCTLSAAWDALTMVKIKLRRARVSASRGSSYGRQVKRERTPTWITTSGRGRGSEGPTTARRRTMKIKAEGRPLEQPDDGGDEEEADLARTAADPQPK